MQALHPVMQQALRPFAPAAVSSRQTRFGRIAEIEFRGADREAVQYAAEERANSIDQYRSPAVSMSRLDGDEWVTTLRFYICD